MVTQLRRRRSPREVFRRSVQEPEMPQSQIPLLWMVGHAADGMLPWGSSNPKPRDRQLRQFYPTEPYLASAVATVAVRNAASEWSIEAPDRTQRKIEDMLHGIHDGRGLEDLTAAISIDLSTQDNGAFIELERMQNTDTSPVINMSHLDSARCYLTGDPEFPVNYIDFKGKWHKIRWFNVLHLREVPDPASKYLQMCAVTRVLRICQILKSYMTYTDEKIGGRFAQAMHLVQGITTDQLNDALVKGQLSDDAKGLLRYATPILLGSINPKSALDFKTIELASLPDHFSQEEWMKWYVIGLAMAFFTDVQEFAPLPGGNLGSSSQSEVLHMKTRGKGPAWFRRIMSNAINYRGVIPQNATFRYDEQDVEEDIQHANLKLIRANARKAMVESGYLSNEAALALAVEEGDVPEEIAAMVDITPMGITPSKPPQTQNEPSTQPAQPGQTQRPSQQGQSSADAVLRRAIEGAPRGRRR